jgi:hypothetical protein
VRACSCCNEKYSGQWWSVRSVIALESGFSDAGTNKRWKYSGQSRSVRSAMAIDEGESGPVVAGHKNTPESDGVSGVSAQVMEGL